MRSLKKIALAVSIILLLSIVYSFYSKKFSAVEGLLNSDQSLGENAVSNEIKFEDETGSAVIASNAPTITTKMANILYSAFRNDIAPAAIYPAICFILSLPGSSFDILAVSIDE